MSPPDHDQLSRRLLHELASLNLRFIRLLVDTRPAACGLTEVLQERLRCLEDSDQRRLAACPYSLFDLQLDDPSIWQQRLAAEFVSAPPSKADSLTLAVLMYTRQLAVENADLGRLLLGLSPRVAEQFRRASIGRLMDMAQVVSDHLRVRLIDDPHFWPDLVSYVKDGTQQQYLAAQTSALQILAARL